VKHIIRKILRESDFEWIDDVKPMSISDLYVIDVSDRTYRETNIILGDLMDLGYQNCSEVPNTACYIYMNYYDNIDYYNPNQRFTVDWDSCNQKDPTYGGDYQIISVGTFNEMINQWKVELDSRVIGESEFEWTDIDPTILHKPYIGMKFHTKIGLMKDASSGSIFVINDITGGDGYWDTGKVVHYTEGDGQYKVPMKYFKKYMEDGDWLTYYDNVNESEFEWAEETPSFNLSKSSHWIILIDGNDELLQVEKFVRNEYGYSNYGSDGLQSDDDLFYNEDGHGGGLTAIEHDPEEGRTVDYLYDGRFAPHQYYYDEYPNALIYKWSDIKKEL